MIQTLKKYLLEKRSFQILFFLSGLLPLLVLGIYTCIIIYQNGTKAALLRRESLGKSIAKLAEVRFNYLIVEGVHYVSHPEFQKLVKEKKWEKALASLVEEQKPIDLSIDRLVLFETDSTAKAGYPYLSDFENIKDNKFADRDWYQGVSRSWEPYVSEIFKRATEPKINVVSVVIPIKSILPEEKGKMLGILNISISLDDFYNWSKTLNTDQKSLLYFVDQKGQVVGHLKYPQEGEIVSYANEPCVQKLLHGEEGVHVIYSSIEKKEKISAYFKIGKYNWGIVMAEDTAEAFRERDSQLRQFILLSAVVFTVSLLVLYLINKLFLLINKYRYQENVLMESIGDGVFVADKKFRIILWNKAASLITGIPSDEILGKNYCDMFKFVNAKTRRDKSHIIQESIRKGEIRHLDSNTIMILNNGREIPIGDSAAPILLGKGRVGGAIVVFRDMTQEYNLNQAKDEFLSIAAHQLRTPLGAMRWNIELLLKEKFGGITKETQGALKDMFHNNLDLISLVNDLLDVSRINQNKVINKPQSIDILPVIKGLLDESKNDIQAKKINLNVECSDTLIPRIKADPFMFRQILRNLISNAIKFNRVKGSIGIKIIQKDSSLLFTIRDSGIGIPKNQLEKVFDKFSRADNAVSLGIAGTGLGLFVVKSYLDIVKGKIWLESEEGKGTAVYFTIPYAQ